MKYTGLKEGETYYKVASYTMKCRLYPNKTQAKLIDDILDGLRVAHNAALYDMFHNGRNIIERKSDDGEMIHYPDIRKIAKAEYFNELKARYPKIQKVPAKAWEGKNGIVIVDMQQMLSSQVGTNKKKKGEKKVKPEAKAKAAAKQKAKSGAKSKIRRLPLRPIEKSEPFYYSKKKPRLSFQSQITCTAIRQKDNPNAIYVNVPKVGHIKCKGWNKRLRFITGEIDFMQYAKMNPKKNLTIKVAKDKCNDYWICFTLQDTLRPARSMPLLRTEVGIDVGVADAVTTSDGVKYDNCRYKRSKQKHLVELNKRLSRRQGWANKAFKESYRHDRSLKPSKSYMRTKLAHAKLERKISRKRADHNHRMTKALVESNSFLGIESLNVTGMIENYKEQHKQKLMTLREMNNRNFNLHDAAMSDILTKLKYKADWYGREIIPIGRYIPSSKLCSCCGYIKKDLTDKIRKWKCPVCRTVHDRDINAAKNILYFALHNEDTAQAA